MWQEHQQGSQRQRDWNEVDGIKRQGQDFDKKFVFEGYAAKKLRDEFLEKSWTKHGVNKLFKKLRDTGTVDRRPGSGRRRSVRTEENSKLLLSVPAVCHCIAPLETFQMQVLTNNPGQRRPMNTRLP